MQDETHQHDSRRLAVAEQLRAGARGYASGAADLLLESYPTIGTAIGSGAFAAWQGFLSQRLVELATAVEFDEPGLFAGDLGWMYTTLTVREIGPEDARRSIGCLWETLEAELPSGSWGIVSPVLTASLEAAGGMASGGDGAPEGEPGGHFSGRGAAGGGAVGELMRSVLRAALAGETRRANRLVLEAFERGTEAARLYEDVLLPVQAEVGTLWQGGRIGIADEHVATEIVRAAMTVLWHAASGNGGDEPCGVAVVGSVTGDHHDAGVRAASQLLDIHGVRGVCLGADVPPEEFAVAAARFGATGAVVSAAMSVHLPRARHAVRALRAVDGPVRVVVGGPAFGLDDGVAGRLAEKLGADGFARTPSAAAGLLVG